MYKKGLALLFFIIFIFLFILFLRPEITNKNPSVPIDYSLLGKNIENRKIDSLLKVEKSFEFYGKANRVELDNKENIIFLNYYDQTLDFYNKQGLKVKTIGQKGEAPWQNNNVVSFFLEDGIGYSLFDAGKQAIKVFNVEDSMTLFSKLSGEYSFSGLLTGMNDWVYSQNQGSDMALVFGKFQIDTFSIYKSISFKNLFEKDVEKFPSGDLDLIFQGYFSGGKNAPVVYTLMYGGYFIITNDKKTFLVRTIDQFPLANYIEKDLGSGIVEHGVNYDFPVNYDAASNSEFHFVLSNVIDNSFGKNRVIDIYSIERGDYIKSIKVPEQKDGQRAIAISVNNQNKVAVLFEDGLVLYGSIPLN